MSDGALLSSYTTLRLGGPAAQLIRATTEHDLVDLVADCDRRGEPVLVLAGGSNVVVADEGYDGTVVLVRTTGLAAETDECSGATVTVAAGEDWDEFVALAVQRGWVGVEALSGIPGSVGATPIQNVGAYGQEVADTIARVRTWDRREGAFRTFAAADCGFGYRTSRFKEEPDRFVVTSVTFQLSLGSLGAPVRYGELSRALGVEAGGRAPAVAVREAVLDLRRGKGMVLDPADHDTWSAGSFFTNPVLSAEDAARLPDEAPRWEQADGRVKTSAAWLTEHAGFGRGWGTEAGAGRATLSTKHTLALTNRGDATTQDLLALAGAVRQGVYDAFGIVLENEPVLVGCTLPPLAHPL